MFFTYYILVFVAGRWIAQKHQLNFQHGEILISAELETFLPLFIFLPIGGGVCTIL